MAGSDPAGKPVAHKLGIKAGTRVWGSAPELLELIGTLPEGAELLTDPGVLDSVPVAVVMAANAAAVTRLLCQAGPSLGRVPVVWVLYPKGNRADINRDTLWPILAPAGLRPNGQVAVDRTWSALRFRPLKPGEPAFTSGSGGS